MTACLVRQKVWGHQKLIISCQPTYWDIKIIMHFNSPEIQAFYHNPVARMILLSWGLNKQTPVLQSCMPSTQAQPY